MKRVYIACPISRGDLDDNIRRARDAMRKLIAAGHSPYNPALTCFADYPDVRVPQVVTLGIGYEQWLRVSEAWVGACDAVLRIPGESVGADAEVELAKSLGVPVFYFLTDLLVHFEGK